MSDKMSTFPDPDPNLRETPITIAFKLEDWILIKMVLSMFKQEHLPPLPELPESFEAYEDVSEIEFLEMQQSLADLEDSRKRLLEKGRKIFEKVGGENELKVVENKISKCVQVIIGCIERKLPFLIHFD